MARVPSPELMAAPADQADSAQTTPSQCGGSPIATVSPASRSYSSTSRFAVFATQFAVVTALSSIRSPVTSS
jgi:hypothetical protein